MLSKQANRYVVLVLLTTLLSACGFHLRETSALPESLRATALQGVTEFSDLGIALKRVFHSDGYTLSQKDKAQTLLKVNRNSFSRRVLSVNAKGDPNEYELTYILEAALLDMQGKVLMPKQLVRVYRSYGYNPDIRLAKDAEEKQVKKSMVQDAVRQLMHRMTAVMPKQALQ